MRRAHGYTLLEVLTSMASLGLLLLATSTLTIYALRAWRLQETRVRPLQAARTTLLQIASDVRSSSRIIEPELTGLETGLHYVVFQAKDDVIAYRTVSGRHEIERIIYSPDYLPGDEQKQVQKYPPAVVARDIEDLKCWEEKGSPGLMWISVTPHGTPGPPIILKTAVFKRL